MKNNYLVSVIIPTIGRSSLKQTLGSVLNQTYQNLEIIITDDTYDCRAKPILSSYSDKRIKYVVNTKYRKGPNGNKNNGLDHVKGEYFLILDDDDFLLSTAVEELMQIVIDKNYLLVFANCIDAISGKFTGKHCGKNEEVSYLDLLCKRYDGEYIGINKTSLFDGVRFNDEVWGYEGLLWLKILKKVNKSFYLHKGLRIYNTSTSDSVLKSYLNNIERFSLGYILFLDYFGDDLYYFCPKQYFKHFIYTVYFLKLANKKKEMIKVYSKSLKYGLRYIFLETFWFIYCLVFPRKFVFISYNIFFKKLKKIFEFLV